MAQRHLKAVPSPRNAPGKRALAYLRVSALMGRGGDDFYSPVMQLGHIDRAMETAGLTNVGTIDDDIDQTGRTFDRKGIARIRALVEGGHIDAIVFYDIKRFGRNVLEGLQFAKWLDGHGVRLVSASESIDTSTPSGRWMFTNMLAMGEFQSDEIGRYWSSLIDRRAQNGEHHGHRLTGYTKIEKKLVPDPLLGPMITGAFHAYADGERSKIIRERWFALTGKRVKPQTLKGWLSNPAYLGRVRLYGRGEDLPGNHEPLVDQATFDLVQERLGREKGEAPRAKVAGWSLSGILYCSHGCRAYQYNTSNRPTSPKVRRLICGMAKGEVVNPCEGFGTPRLDETESAVLEQVKRYIARLRLDATAIAEVAQRRTTGLIEVGQLKAQLASTLGAMTKLTLAFGQGQIPSEAFDAAMSELTASEAATKQQLAIAETAVKIVNPLEVAAAAETLLRLWPEMSDYERNGSLKAVIGRVVVRRAAHRGEPMADRIELEPW